MTSIMSKRVNHRATFFRRAVELGYNLPYRTSTVVELVKYINANSTDNIVLAERVVKVSAKRTARGELFHRAKAMGYNLPYNTSTTQNLSDFIKAATTVVKKNVRGELFRQARTMGYDLPYNKSTVKFLSDFIEAVTAVYPSSDNFANGWKPYSIKEFLKFMRNNERLPALLNIYIDGTADTEMGFVRVNTLADVFALFEKVYTFTGERYENGRSVPFTGLTGLAVTGYDIRPLPTDAAPMRVANSCSQRVVAIKTATKATMFNLENCLVKILRHYASDRLAKLYANFPQFDPLYNITSRQPMFTVDDDVFYDVPEISLTGDDIEELAKKMGFNISLYTSLGAQINVPWRVYGGETKRKKIDAVVSNGHATVKPGKFKISAIDYSLDNFDDKEIFNVDCGYTTDPETKKEMLYYYIELKDNKFIMHKSYKPSTITKNLDDDSDLAYAYMFNNETVTFHKFLKFYNIERITDDKVQQIVKSAENFIGKKIFEEVCAEKGDYEIDHNRNYSSFDKNPFYVGFPRPDSLSIVDIDAVDNPAFVVLNKYPEVNEQKNPAYYRFFGNRLVITYPVYKYLLSIGAKLDIKYALAADFFKVDLYDFASKWCTDPADQKLCVNSLIGRFITGGVKNERLVRCRYGCPEELDRMSFECVERGFSFTDTKCTFTKHLEEVDYCCNMGEDEGPHYAESVYSSGFLNVVIPNTKKNHISMHSFILGYAAVSVMLQWDKIAAQGGRVIAFNVDSLIVRGVPIEDLDINISIERGDWKHNAEPPKYPYGLSQLTQKGKAYPLYKNILPEILPNEIAKMYFKKNTRITGPAGCSKSYPFYSNPLPDSIYLTPTIALRDEIRLNAKTLGVELTVETFEKYFQTSMSDARFRIYLSSPAGRRYRNVIIDEYTMFSAEKLKRALLRSPASRFILLGDTNQICNAIDGTAVDESFFSDWDKIEIKRTRATKARQHYEFGCLLDSLRDKTYDQQVEVIRQNWDLATPKTLLTDAKHVIVGNHAVANSFNRIYAFMHPSEMPVKTIGKNPTIMYLPADNPHIWWDRATMRDAPPQYARYEPAFAATADSFQGKTMDNLAIHLPSLNRQGTLYTAMTRARQHNLIYPINFDFRSMSDGLTDNTRAILFSTLSLLI